MIVLFVLVRERHKYLRYGAQVEERYVLNWLTRHADDQLESMTSSLKLTADWFAQRNTANASESIAVSCISRLYALYEDHDAVTIYRKNKTKSQQRQFNSQTDQMRAKIPANWGETSSSNHQPNKSSTYDKITFRWLHLAVCLASLLVVHLSL